MIHGQIHMVLTHIRIQPMCALHVIDLGIIFVLLQSTTCLTVSEIELSSGWPPWVVTWSPIFCAKCTRTCSQTLPSMRCAQNGKPLSFVLCMQQATPSNLLWRTHVSDWFSTQCGRNWFTDYAHNVFCTGTQLSQDGLKIHLIHWASLWHRSCETSCLSCRKRIETALC